ncbi:MAG: extracellular solute-binding protein [Christensenella sp.]
MKNANLKRAIALAMTALMSLSLAACGNKPVSSTSAPASGSAIKDSFAETRKISLAVLDNVTDEEWKNDYHNFFKEKFNIEWDYNYVEWDSWDEKLRVWINSDDLPDVSIWNYNYTDFASYAEQDLLYKFPEDWKERWPNAARAYSASPLNTELEKRFGGTYIMLRPVFVNNAQTDPVVNQIGVAALRKDWADAVGFELKDEYTVDETLEYARLVKEKDPGKIGKTLVPLCLDPANAMTHFISSQCNHARLETAIYKNSDGKYTWGPSEKEVLEALEIYQKAYRDGLLDPEFYLMNDNDKDKFYINGTAAMYQMGGVADFRQTCDAEMRNNLQLNSDDVVQNAIVLGNDKKYHNVVLGSNFWSSLIFSPNISKENFERTMDMIDWTCTDDGQIICNMGLEGVDWEYKDQKPVSILAEGTSVFDKYGARIESLYILEDDFAVINPAIKEDYRIRMNSLAQLKLDKAEGEYSEIDWDEAFYTSKSKDQAQLDYATEYANLIVQKGDLETNWNAWVTEKMLLVQPYLDELNAMK